MIVKRYKVLKPSLLDPKLPIFVNMFNRTICTELAANTFNDLPIEERARYQGMTDLEIIEAVYKEYFGWN